MTGKGLYTGEVYTPERFIHRRGLNHGMQEPLNHGMQEPLHHGMQDAPNHGMQDAPNHGMQEPLPTMGCRSLYPPWDAGYLPTMGCRLPTHPVVYVHPTHPGVYVHPPTLGIPHSPPVPGVPHPTAPSLLVPVEEALGSRGYPIVSNSLLFSTICQKCQVWYAFLRLITPCILGENMKDWIASG